MSEQAIGTEIAGYRIESVIGRGGMAVVYRAEDTRLGRKVALKLLTPALNEQEQFKQRFIQESRLAASLDHPNIIPIYEAGNADGLLFIAMRYVVGSDLKVALGGKNHLSSMRVVKLFEQIGDALDAAHEHGLVHRDVKPGNVLLASVHEQADHVYLTDFGLTKRASSLTGGLTGTGHFLGTIDYVAPEQIAGKPVDGRTDIYALGCVLYECFTGQVPFHRDDDAATLWAHLVEPPPPVTAVRSDLSPEVDAVVARALAKAPEERYGSCHEFVQDLQVALELAPAPGARLLGGIDTTPPLRRRDREFEQEPYAPEPDPDATRHPSLPPGAFGNTPRVSRGSSYRADSSERDAEVGYSPDDAADDADYIDEYEDDGYAEDDAYTDYPEERSWEDTDSVPERRQHPMRRWLVIGAILFLAAATAATLIFVLPSKHPVKLSQHYVGGSNVLVPFSLDVPSNWTPLVGPGTDVVIAPAVTSVANLFFTTGDAASWAPVHALLTADRSKAVGVWILTLATTFDRSTPDVLQKAVTAVIPSNSFTPGYTSQVVGGMPSDEMTGQFEDPQDPTNQLQFVMNVVRYTGTAKQGSALVVFFAPPDKYAGDAALFDRIRSSIVFPPS